MNIGLKRIYRVSIYTNGALHDYFVAFTCGFDSFNLQISLLPFSNLNEAGGFLNRQYESPSFARAAHSFFLRGRYFENFKFPLPSIFVLMIELMDILDQTG